MASDLKSHKVQVLRINTTSLSSQNVPRSSILPCVEVSGFERVRKSMNVSFQGGHWAGLCRVVWSCDYDRAFWNCQDNPI